MDCLFEEGVDSWGRLVPCNGYDESRYTDRYMPDPTTLPPRAFTVVNHSLDNDDKRLVLLLDHDGNIVRQYTGSDDPDDNKQVTSSRTSTVCSPAHNPDHDSL